MNPHALYRRLSPLLRPLATPYALLMRERRRRYASGEKEAYRPACPCVSVGNIAWGGAGKTPFTSFLLHMAEAEGKKAVVLLRGYKASPGERPLLVGPRTPVNEAGDEALLLARAHPKAAVVVFPKRAEAARFAERTLSPDLLVLDDGMQHLALARDTDIVLLRPEDLTDQWDRVIPGGSWREPASALAAASVFAAKMTPEECERLRPLIYERLEAFGIPFFSFTLEPAGLRPLAAPPEESAGADLQAHLCKADIPLQCSSAPGPYLLISGVGAPAGVEASAERSMGGPPIRHAAFGDHHAYTEKEVTALAREADLHSAELPFLCTTKDAVKLEHFLPLFHKHPVLVMETRLVFGPAIFTSLTFPEWRRQAMVAAPGVPA